MRFVLKQRATGKMGRAVSTEPERGALKCSRVASVRQDPAEVLVLRGPLAPPQSFEQIRLLCLSYEVMGAFSK